MIKTNILKVKGDWKEVLNDCRFTANKPDLDKEPSKKFRKSVLIAEHSPIRDIIFKWEWLDIPHWVTVHWVRHKWEKYVQTQRPDRTGVGRGTQEDPQSMRGEANVQNLIDTMRKRLCYGVVSTKTRQCAESLKMEINTIDEDIASVLVPNCIYRGGCPEGDSCCGYWQRFVEIHGVIDNIEERYRVYNEDFNKIDIIE